MQEVTGPQQEAGYDSVSAALKVLTLVCFFIGLRRECFFFFFSPVLFDTRFLQLSFEPTTGQTEEKRRSKLV